MVERATTEARETSNGTSQRDLSTNLLDSLDFGLLALSAEHRILFANRKALEILDTSPLRLLGNLVGDLLLSRTPGYSLWPDKRVDQDAEPREVMLEFEGRELLLQVRWLPISDRGLGSSILAFEDVTEVVGEMEFQRRVDRFASVEELAAVIAHEIRNPLTGIRTTIQYVGSKLEDRAGLRSDLEDAIHELDRIEQFTTDLLQFTRPKSLQMTVQDLTPILAKVLDNLEMQFRLAGITVKRELADFLPAIPLDPDAIQQVFLNLVLNAIDAMNGGGQLRVSTSSRWYRSKQAVEVAFHDTGCGIPEDVLDKIFDPFFTTRDTGTGLGLSVVHQIVTQHGGTVTVTRNQDKGTTFSLFFPQSRGDLA